MDMSVYLYCYLQTTWYPFSWLHVFLTLPSLHVFSGLPLSINSDSVVRSECLEREPPKLYPSCSSTDPCRPFPLGYQDASPSVGIPLQQSFQHLSYSHYQGGGLVSPIPDIFKVPPYFSCPGCFNRLSPRQPATVLTLYQDMGSGWKDTALTLCAVHLWECTCEQVGLGCGVGKRLWELRQKGMQTHLR